MTPSPAPVPTVRVARSRPGLSRAVAVAALLVALAFVKPWDQLSRGPLVPGRRLVPPTAVAAAVPDAASATIVPTPEPSLERDQIACPVGDWQVVSLDRLATWTVRTWLPASPAAADGPLDPAIPTIALESPAVLAVGLCAPGTTDAAGDAAASVAARVVGAWRLSGGRASAIVVSTLIGPTPTSVRADLALLYRPDATGPDRAWAPGRYVLEVDSGAGRRFIGLLVPPRR
jgi:hypothetical protein